MWLLFLYQSVIISIFASDVQIGFYQFNVHHTSTWGTVVGHTGHVTTSYQYGRVLGMPASIDYRVLMRFCLIRSLGLYIRGVEEESRSRKEGLFQEDECIIKINNTDLMDKTFSQSVQHGSLCHILPVSSRCLCPVAFTHPISCLVLHHCETAAENRCGCPSLVYHWHQF